MGTFNPDTFLATETNDALATKYTAVPAGDYQAMIDDLEPGKSTKGAGNPFLRVKFRLINVAELAEKLNKKDGITIDSTFWLDLNEAGGLDIGANKNVRLGKLREACGQNISGKPWSPLMLKGAGPIWIKVTERPDDKNPDDIYNDIAKFAPVR